MVGNRQITTKWFFINSFLSPLISWARSSIIRMFFTLHAKPKNVIQQVERLDCHWASRKMSWLQCKQASWSFSLGMWGSWQPRLNCTGSRTVLKGFTFQNWMNSCLLGSFKQLDMQEVNIITSYMCYAPVFVCTFNSNMHCEYILRDFFVDTQCKHRIFVIFIFGHHAGPTREDRHLRVGNLEVPYLSDGRCKLWTRALNAKKCPAQKSLEDSKKQSDCQASWRLESEALRSSEGRLDSVCHHQLLRWNCKHRKQVPNLNFALHWLGDREGQWMMNLNPRSFWAQKSLAEEAKVKASRLEFASTVVWLQDYTLLGVLWRCGLPNMKKFFLLMIFLEVQRFGDSRVALIGFPSAGTFGSKLPLLSSFMHVWRVHGMRWGNKQWFASDNCHQQNPNCILMLRNCIRQPANWKSYSILVFLGHSNLNANLQNPFHPKKYWGRQIFTTYCTHWGAVRGSCLWVHNPDLHSRLEHRRVDFIRDQTTCGHAMPCPG